MLPNAVVHSQSYSVALGSLVSIPRGAETIQVSGQDHPFWPPPPLYYLAMERMSTSVW
jgi:hypothetical protein